MEKTTFAGDVLLDGSEGFGNIIVENGLIKDCRDFSTSAYLSLFGGNKSDDAGREKETWWGNLVPGTKENEKITSSFYAIVTGFPLTSNNIKRAVQAAGNDLAWFKKEGIADDISVSLTAESNKRVSLSVEIKKNGNDILKDTYSFQWQEVMNGLRKQNG